MFVKKPRSSEACEGDTVIIYCEVVGDPKPDVVWLRDFLKVNFVTFFLLISFDNYLTPFMDIELYRK